MVSLTQSLACVPARRMLLRGQRVADLETASLPIDADGVRAPAGFCPTLAASIGGSIGCLVRILRKPIARAAYRINSRLDLVVHRPRDFVSLLTRCVGSIAQTLASVLSETRVRQPSLEAFRMTGG